VSGASVVVAIVVLAILAIGLGALALMLAKRGQFVTMAIFFGGICLGIAALAGLTFLRIARSG
jgi:maltodextrin utilization protein YvdJ